MTEQDNQQVETPHKIKGFDAIAHDAMIRRMAHQVIQNNKSSLETVNKHVSGFKAKIKAHKVEQNQFKRTANKAKKLAELANLARHSANVAEC